MSDNTKGTGFTEEENNTLTLKTNHLLAIGIDKYQHQSILKNPVDDCQKIIEVLCKQYRFEQKNVNTLFNKAATRDNIINALWDYRKLTDQDNLLILFSGHGDYDQPSDVGFWVPVNAQGPSQYITKADIAMQLKAFKAHHVALIIDSCFSGAMTKELKKNAQKDNRNYFASIRSYKKKSRWAMTSGRVELVYDGNAGEHSPFAQSLISELKNNDKGMLLFSELGVAVRNITNRNADQDPSCRFLQNVGDMDGEFSFILKDYQPLENVTLENAIITRRTTLTEETTIAKEEIKNAPLMPQGVDAIKKQIQNLIIEDEIKKAYQYLMDKLKDDCSLYNTTINRYGGWNKLEKNIAIGIAMNVSQQQAEHRQALNYIISNMKEDDLAK